MTRNWRTWVLIALFLGPSLVYMGLGAIWLTEHQGPIGFRGELLLYGVLAWVVTGVAFAILGNRWTRKSRPLLPPLDWKSPETFAPQDTQAWQLVQEEAKLADELPMDALSRFDTFEKSGLTIARRLANHYHPESADPIDQVPIVELLTALQLAAEDLARMCRDLPGGDLVTPAHCKRAAKAAGYVQRVSDFYNVLLPVFQPLTGMARLGVQKLVVQPAWRDMQRNLLRWFFEAYLNRLGFHLVELYSGRLAAGAEAYRKISGRTAQVRGAWTDLLGRPLIVAVVGAKGSGRSTLIEGIQRTLATDAELVRKELDKTGIPSLSFDLLKRSQMVEAAAYPVGGIGSKDVDQKLWEQAVSTAASADLVLLTLDAASSDHESDCRFLEAWSQTIGPRNHLERPPLLAVMTHADRPELGSGWFPPYDWKRGQRPREQAIRQKLDAARASLIPAPAVILAVASPAAGAPAGFADALLPELALQLEVAERSALLRAIQEQHARSRGGRLLGQLGREGKKILKRAKPRFWSRPGS